MFQPSYIRHSNILYCVVLPPALHGSSDLLLCAFIGRRFVPQMGYSSCTLVCAVTTVQFCYREERWQADRQRNSYVVLGLSEEPVPVCVQLTAIAKLTLYLWLNPKVHCRVHKSSQLIPVYTEINSPPLPTPNSFPSDIICPSAHRTLSHEYCTA